MSVFIHKPTIAHKLISQSLVTAVAVALMTPVQATNFTVTNTNDAGIGSLRQSVIDANATVGEDIIFFDSTLINSTISLTTGEISVTDELTIGGPTGGVFDVSGITIVGNSESRLFNVSGDVPLTLKNLTLTGGSASCRGGAIYGGFLVLSNTTISGNMSGPPLRGFVPLSCSGGGLYASSVVLNRSTISGNTAIDSAGGGVSAATLVLHQSTVSGNSAGRSGGIHIQSHAGDVTLFQSTITHNSSADGAGGLGVDINGTAKNVSLTNTILAGNNGLEGNFASKFFDDAELTVNVSHSLFGDDSTKINGTNTANVFENNPDLGLLQDNGGSTLTHLPNSGSPALDAGDNYFASSTDQRGGIFSGIVNNMVDIGAVERQTITGISTVQQQLSENRLKWQQSAIASYELSVKFSPEFNLRDNLPILFRIQNNIVVDRFYDCSNLDSTQLIPRCNKKLEGEFKMTVDALFALIDNAIKRNTDIINVEYDPVHGYPTSIFTDELSVADESFTYQVTHFMPLDDVPLLVKQSDLFINHQWRTAPIGIADTSTVVFYSAASSFGAERGVARMRNGSTDFEFKFQEWSNLDGWHTEERINLLKLSKGRWSFGEHEVEVDSKEVSDTEQWISIKFSKAFKQPPQVIVALQTTNGSDAVGVRVLNITNTSMQVQLVEEDLKKFSGHVPETLGYLLVSGVDANFITEDSVTFDLSTKAQPIKLNHNWQTVVSGYQLRLEEDQTQDAEVIHVKELVHLLGINGIYFGQLVSDNGDDNAVLRSRRE